MVLHCSAGCDSNIIIFAHSFVFIDNIMSLPGRFIEAKVISVLEVCISCILATNISFSTVVKAQSLCYYNACAWASSILVIELVVGLEPFH